MAAAGGQARIERKGVFTRTLSDWGETYSAKVFLVWTPLGLCKERG